MKLQRGFTLVELVVTLGLMGMVSLITMKVMENQSASQLSVEATAEINSTVSLIAGAINDPVKCNQMFAGRNINSVINELRYQVTTSVPPADVYLLQSRNAGKIYRYFYIDDGDMTLSQDPTNMGMANLNIFFNVQSMAISQKINLFSHINSRTVRRQIPFNVVTDAALNILSCGPLASRSNLVAKQIACESLDNTGLVVWDAGSSRCRLRKNICPPGQIPVNFDAAGNIRCRTGGNQVRVEEIFDLSYMTNSCAGSGANIKRFWGIVADPTTGKLRINCTAF